MLVVPREFLVLDLMQESTKLHEEIPAKKKTVKKRKLGEGKDGDYISSR